MGDFNLTHCDYGDGKEYPDVSLVQEEGVELSPACFHKALYKPNALEYLNREFEKATLLGRYLVQTLQSSDKPVTLLYPADGGVLMAQALKKVFEAHSIDVNVVATKRIPRIRREGDGPKVDIPNGGLQDVLTGGALVVCDDVIVTGGAIVEVLQSLPKKAHENVTVCAGRINSKAIRTTLDSFCLSQFIGFMPNIITAETYSGQDHIKTSAAIDVIADIPRDQQGAIGELELPLIKSTNQRGL